MSSKAVALTMGDSCYQTSDKTTMSQRQVTWGLHLMHLVGLLVCFMFVWYVVKLQTEVTTMNSQLAEHTRQINELRYLCQKHGTTGDNTGDRDLDDWETTDEEVVSADDSYEDDGLDIEVELEYEPRLDETDAYDEMQALEDGPADIADDVDREMSKKVKRHVHNDGEPSHRSGGPTQTHERECRRACRNNKELPAGCEPCQNLEDEHPPVANCEPCKYEHPPVVSAHFVGDAPSVVSVGTNQKNPEMAIVGGLIPHWQKADWMNDTQNLFDLDMHGNVTVRKAGIYFIYSQVQYYDENAFTGHSILVNGEKFVSCIECPVDSYRKFSTCYIGGVTQLQENSQVGLNITRPTMIRLRRDSSYFGFIKLD